MEAADRGAGVVIFTSCSSSSRSRLLSMLALINPLHVPDVSCGFLHAPTLYCPSATCSIACNMAFLSILPSNEPPNTPGWYDLRLCPWGLLIAIIQRLRAYLEWRPTYFLLAMTSKLREFACCNAWIEQDKSEREGMSYLEERTRGERW